MGGRVSEVRPSNCFSLHPTSMISKYSTIPVPDSLYRRLEKLVLPSIFDVSLSPLTMWIVKLAKLYNNSFEWNNVTFWGSKRTLTPPTYFQGIKTPQPPGYTSLITLSSQTNLHKRAGPYNLITLVYITLVVDVIQTRRAIRDRRIHAHPSMQ